MSRLTHDGHGPVQLSPVIGTLPKKVSTGCGRTSRSVRVLRWICGVKPKPQAVNKLLHYFILHGLDKPGSSATVSINSLFREPCAVKATYSVLTGGLGRRTVR